MRLRAAVCVIGGTLLLGPGVAEPSAATRPPRVTVISDSVAASIGFDTGARAILADGIDLFFEPGPARRLGGETPAGGIAPPTAIDLIAKLGRRLGSVVIICVGNNDISSQYAQNMEVALGELRSVGVRRVLWTTLHETPAHLGNATINAAIRAEAAIHPEVTVVDWNSYAAGHPEWFVPDGVHLAGSGPRALARLLHASLVQLHVPTGS